MSPFSFDTPTLSAQDEDRCRVLGALAAYSTVETEPVKRSFIARLKYARPSWRGLKYRLSQYFGWRHSWLASTLTIVIVFAVALFSYNVTHAATSTATMVPDGDVSVTGWAVGASADTSCAGGILCDTVDEGTSANLADYIHTSTTNGGETVEFSLDNVSSVASASQLTLNIDAMANTVGASLVDTLSVNIIVNGTPQTASTCTPGNGAWLNCTATFSGSWDQTAVNSMQVQIVRNVQGSGGNPASRADDTWIANVYGTLTYVPSLTVAQSAYRWFDNQDTTSSSTLFGSNAQYATGTNPYEATVADFNNDGSPDIATANNFDGTVSVLLNNGDGTFAAKKDTPAPSSTRGLVAGDFNGDGKTDLVSISTFNSSFALYLGNNDGTFAPYTTISTSTYGYAVAAADLNGDGKLDVVVAYGGSNGVGVFLGNGDGTFGTESTYTTTLSPKSIAIADVNGDDKEDILVAGTGVEHSVSVLLNNGNGTFAAKKDSAISAVPVALATADFNDDSQTDIVTVSSSGTVTVLNGDGAGNFSTAATFTGGGTIYDVATADFNGDGNQDIVVPDYAAHQIAVFLGNGDDTFSSAISYDTQGTNPRWINVADFDGDSKMDVAVTNYGSSTVSVPLGLLPTPIDVGVPLTANQDTAATAPSEGTIFRLRLDLHIAGALVNANQLQLKLQYAELGTAASCSDVLTGKFDDVTDTSTGIRWADNTNAVSGTSLTENANDPVHGTDNNVYETYQEAGTTTFTNPAAIPDGQDGLWDFGLVAHHSLQNTSYCFRVVKSDDTLLDGYDVYPQINMPAATFSMGAYRWYNPEPPGSSSTFIKSYYHNTGNPGWTDSYLKDVVDTSDGGYAATGYTTETDPDRCGPGCNAVYTEANIIKYDSSGNIAWSKAWGSIANNTGSYGESIVQTSDGGYAITGYTDSFGAGGNDMFLAKYDSSGNLLWSKTWGDANDNAGKSLMEDSSGNLLVVGESNNDMFLAKYNSAGTLLSASTMSSTQATGGSGSEGAVSIAPCSDGGYIIADAATNGNGTGFMELIRADSSGAILWTRSITGSQLGGLVAESAVELQDGSIAVVGYSHDSSGATAVKYDSNGNFQWSHSWGGGGQDIFYDVAATSDGGFVAVGSTSSYGQGGSDVLAAKYQSDGKLSWSKTWGNTNDNEGFGITLTSDGGFAVVGYTKNGSYANMVLLKYDSSGSISGCPALNCQPQTPSGSDEDTTASTPTTTWTASAIADNKLGYSVGDIGPAGGTIFYVDSDNKYPAFDYMEIAPAFWQGGSLSDPSADFGCYGSSTGGARGLNIGDGLQNTADIIAACGGSTAAAVADNATYGGYSDWFLPSLGELQTAIPVSGDVVGTYWSSSALYQPDVPSQIYNDAYAVQDSGGLYEVSRDTSENVRPVREFTGIQPGLGSYDMTTTTIVGSGVNVGNPMADNNHPLDLSNLTPLNLRIDVQINGSGIDTNGQSFQLEYAIKKGETSCAEVSTANYLPITTATPIAYYDDPDNSDDQPIVDNPNDPTDGSRTNVAESYQESNPFTDNAAPVYAGQDGMWQFSLAINNSTLKGRDFCLRVATSSGSVLNAVNVADVAYAPQMYQLMRGGNWFSRNGVRQNLIL